MNKSVVINVFAASTVALLLGGCGGTASNGAAPSAGTSSAGVAATVSPSPLAVPTESPVADDWGSGATFAKGVLLTPYFKLVITDQQVIKPGAKGSGGGDKPLIVFSYKTTRLGDRDVDPVSAWIFNLTAFQDKTPSLKNELPAGPPPDVRFADAMMYKIKKGDTVDCAVAYELDDLKTPVNLVAETILGEEIGRQSFKIG